MFKNEWSVNNRCLITCKWIAAYHHTYQYGVPTNELAGLTNDAEPKSAEREKINHSKLDSKCFIDTTIERLQQIHLSLGSKVKLTASY